MKKLNTLTSLLTFLFISVSHAQNSWDISWSLDQMPFAATNSSEMSIVKAGFDTDEDGWGEFICAYSDLDSNFILMYEASANDNYDLVWSWKYPVNANTFPGIAVGDLDGNGTVEIITTMPSVADGTNPPRLWVFEWNGVTGENKYGSYIGGTSAPHAQWNFDLPDNTDFRPYSLTIEDIDNDANNELIVGTRQGDRGREVMVVSVTGIFVTGFVGWNIEYNLQGLTGGAMYSVTTGDLDNDGKREIHALLWDLFTLRIIECTGPNTFQLVNELIEVFPNYDFGALDGVGVADVNNDGTNEMYVAGMNGLSGPNQLFMITNTTDVSTIDSADVKKFYRLPGIGTSGLRSMYIADPDADGKTDLMIAGERNGQIFDLEYKGTGDPADTTNWELNIAFDLFEIVSADLGITIDSAQSVVSPRFFYGHPAQDMDKDGKNEYVFVNYSADWVSWPADQCLWVIESGDLSNIDLKGNGIPKRIVLSQNYPNPFNPETKFSYDLQKAGNVSIIIYDLLGRKIRTLANGFNTAGKHSVEWDGLTDLGNEAASGVYIYKLKANGKELSRKMNLVR